MSGSRPDGPLPESDLAACREIAGRSGNNLLHAARLLPKARQDFFLAAYAAMRVIDDLVDDGFLLRPAADRAAMRAEILGAIDRWEGQCLSGDSSEDGPLPPPVRRAMHHIVRPSDLGAGPWQGLADAMRRDAAERPMRNWQDFLDYAAGATVAPATIFIYLLAATPTENGFRLHLPEPPEHYAADLAIFCYLVHILRDLSKDAERSERLLTIPEDMLRAAGLEKSGLLAALGQRDSRVGALAAALRTHAGEYLRRGEEKLDRLATFLGPREFFALKGLIAIYRKLFESFTDDFFRALASAPVLEEKLRGQLLKSPAP